VYGRGQALRGNKNWVPSTLYGTTPGFIRVRDWDDMAEGEAFTDDDVRDTALVCVLGHTVVRELFPDESPIGEEVVVNDVPLRVVGVLRRKGADIIGEDQDDILLAPWTTLKFGSARRPLRRLRRTRRWPSRASTRQTRSTS